MRRIELLASMLDAEVKPHEIQAPEKSYGMSIAFWNLCLEARRQLMEERKEEEEAPVEKKPVVVPVTQTITSAPRPINGNGVPLKI